MPDLLQPWMEVRNIVLTNRKHRRREFVLSCSRDAAFAINVIAVNASDRDIRLFPEIFVSFESQLAPLKAIYESRPQPPIVLQPGEVLKGCIELSPTAELGRTRPLIQIIFSGVKNYGTANEQPPGSPAPAGGNGETKS